jgi:hypothetical protein
MWLLKAKIVFSAGEVLYVYVYFVLSNANI